MVISKHKLASLSRICEVVMVAGERPTTTTYMSSTHELRYTFSHHTHGRRAHALDVPCRGGRAVVRRSPSAGPCLRKSTKMKVSWSSNCVFFCDRESAAGNILLVSRIRRAKLPQYHAFGYFSARSNNSDGRPYRAITEMWVVKK